MAKTAGQTITKTVVQYSEPIPPETAEFLRGIAGDYAKVKNAVYERYSGVRSVNKLASVYTVQNEMRHCGLRSQLGLPVVYYEIAIAEALADLKSTWAQVKSRMILRVNEREDLAETEKIYIRTVLQNNHIYAEILAGRPHEAVRNAAGEEINEKKLDNLLRRMTRKYRVKPHADITVQDSFTVTPNGYSYKDGALRLVSRVPRRRIAIPMRDGREFDRQLLVKIRDGHIEVNAPVETKVKVHRDYTNDVFAYIGYTDMLTLSDGSVYGRGLGKNVTQETERLYEANRQRCLQADAQNVKPQELGDRKYRERKRRERERTKTFINTELNRMIEEQKPCRIIIPRAITINPQKSYSPYLNRKLSRSYEGYIRERIRYKGKLHGIEVVEINSKGTGSVCSSCGAQGRRGKGVFECDSCGLSTTIPLNSAKNIENKYRKG